jgi:hypothetical protein
MAGKPVLTPRERRQQDDARLRELVGRTRAERGVVSRRLAVFAVGMWDGDTDDLVAVLERLFDTARFDFSEIVIHPMRGKREEPCP